MGLPSLASGACHVEAAPSVFVEFIRIGRCALLREAGVSKMSLFLPELPGFHNPALLQGDLGTSGRSHGYGSRRATGRVRHGWEGQLSPWDQFWLRHGELDAGCFYPL